MSLSKLFTKKPTVKNSRTEEVEYPRNLDLLNKWTIPEVRKRTIYNYGFFDYIGLKHTIKTTEESISLNNDEMIIQLLNEHDLEPYRRSDHRFIHIGLVQVAFKPLTLEGLPESFIAALRDGRNLDWQKSIIGVVKSSLAHGPVYFDVYPNLQLSLTDANIIEALTLNVKTHGYNYAKGSELICICYRIYYKPLYTLNPQCKLADKAINETILIETNCNKSNITTRKSIKWEEISFPENWTISQAMLPQPIMETNLLSVKQTPEGAVTLNFSNNNYSRPRSSNSRISRSFSNRTFISALDHDLEDLYEPSIARCSTSQIREEENNEIEEDIIRLHSDNILRKHSKKDAETMSQMSYTD